VSKFWIFVVVTVSALILSAIYALRQPLEFETSAVVRLKRPPLPPEFAADLGWNAEVLRSADLAIQVAKRLPVPEGQTEGRWEIISWLYQHLQITSTDGEIISLRLRGGFAPRAVRDTLAAYLAHATEKLKADLKASVDAEHRRLGELRATLQNHRAQLLKELNERLEQQRAALQAQREMVQKELQDFLKPRIVQTRIGEPGATIESWYLRRQLEILLERLTALDQELDRLQTEGVRALAGEYRAVIDIEERLVALARAQAEAKRLLESNWEPMDTVTPPQLPQGPVGPDRLALILWGTGGGAILGLFVALFFPTRRLNAGRASAKDRKTPPDS
jgi:uncharacterized protein involved in exopolysaccharide biosynthesis